MHPNIKQKGNTMTTHHPTHHSTHDQSPTTHNAGNTGNLFVQTLRDDDGMSTIEYAMGSLAAAALAAVLYTVINGNSVTQAIQNIITTALNNSPA